jgi:hypothetical protein
MMRGSINNVGVWVSEKDKLNLEDEEERNLDKHFRHTGKAGTCDHCTYFKGIVWRTLSGRDPVDLDGLRSGIATDTYTEGAISAPRSLESVALKEEAIEKAQHNAHIKWCASRIVQSWPLEQRNQRRHTLLILCLLLSATSLILARKTS